MNSWDPSGEFSPTPACAGQQSASSKMQLEAMCWAEQAYMDRRLGHPVQLNSKRGIDYSCSVDSSDFTKGSINASLPISFMVSLPPVHIPTTSGIDITIQSDVSIAANSNQPINFSLGFDGSFAVQSGNSSVNFSPTGAFDGLTDGNWGVTPNGVSYTDTISHTLGPDVVTADITATVQPTGTSSSGSISPDLEKGAVVAGAGVSVVVIIWWGAKVLSPLCGPLILACALGG